MFSVFSSQGLKPDTTRPLLAGETDAEFIARERNENPTLNDLTKSALNVLGKDKDGFWLMIEGGDIDWAAHDNNMDNLIGTVNDFDKAVKSTIDWINQNGGWEENLLIVTADHDHYLTLTSDFPTALKEKGAEALTEIDDYKQVGHYWGSNPQKDGKYGWGNHSNRPVPVYYQGAGSEVLTSLVGKGYNSYGYDIPGIYGLVDQVNIYQTMYQAITGKPAVQYGTDSDEILYGGDGNDEIIGGAGNNIIFANEGNNRITTGKGNDLIYAGSGDDVIYSGAGDDTIYANEGKNTISVGTGNDTVYAGSGVDKYILDAGAGSVNIIGFGANDQISRGSTLLATDILDVKISGNNTLISKGSDLLATLKDVQLNSITIL